MLIFKGLNIIIIWLYFGPPCK